MPSRHYKAIMLFEFQILEHSKDLTSVKNSSIENSFKNFLKDCGTGLLC